ALPGDRELRALADQGLEPPLRLGLITALLDLLDRLERSPDLLAVLAEILLGAVEALASYGIREHLVRRPQALQLLRACVRWILPDQLEICLLDGAFVGGALDLEDLIMVLRAFGHERYLSASVDFACSKASTREST